VFIQPDDVTRLIEEGKMPFNFYKVQPTAKDEIEPVLRNSPLYNEVQKIIRDYMPNVMDIEIVGAKGSVYDTETRAKIEGDERTYADLAAQFGFSPEATETKVPLKQVLQAIINSEYATPDEKALAEELLKKAVEGETVTFVNNLGNPGTYSESKQTIIDARYSSHNYRGGVLPIEHVILHEEIHRRTVNALQEDPEFSRKIDDLYAKAKEHFETVKIPGQAEYYGLANKAEFVAEAMSNSVFQQYLASIPYDATEATVWTKFVDAVLDAMEALFGVRVSNTVLNEALSVITSKIDIEFGTAEPVEIKEGEPTTPIATADNVKVTASTTPADIKNQELYPGLATRLIQAYNEANRERRERGEVPFDPMFETRPEDEVVDTAQFQTWYRTSSAARNIRDTYNDETGRTVEPGMEPVTQGDITIMSNAMQAELRSRGYDPRTLTVAQAQEILADPNRTKETDDTAVVDTAAGQIQEQMRVQLLIDLMK
jgi:hypothetical protein